MLICITYTVAQSQALDYLPEHTFEVPGFNAHMITTGFRGVNSVCTADLDGDGDPDLITASTNHDKITWWENLELGSGSFYKHVIDTEFNGAYGLYASDMDLDGDPDILAGNSSGKEIAWWENLDGTTFQKHVVDSSFRSSHSVLMIDFDFDGDVDVLAASKFEGDIAWYENDGAEQFTRHLIERSYSNVSSIDAVDMEGDGDIDIMGTNTTTISWWENNNLENYSRHQIADGLMLGVFLIAANLDNDGDIDVIGVDKYRDEITFWENDGSFAFTKVTVDNDINWPGQVCIADMDMDSDMDILAVSELDNYVCWYENQGQNTFPKRIVQSGYSGANAIYADDLDLDGDMDIVATAENTGDFYWWENTLLSDPNKMFPDLAFDPDILEFYVGPDGSGGETSDGSENSPGATGQLTIRNMGNAILLVQEISSEAAWVTGIDTSQFILSPDSSQVVIIECSAGELYNGTYTDSLRINSNDPDTPEIMVPMVLELTGGKVVPFIGEREPNNQPSDANLLYGPSPSAIWGTVSVDDKGSITVLDDDVEDLYMFTLLSGPLKMTLSDATADLDLLLLKIEGNTTNVYFSNHRGAAIDEVYEDNDLEPGDYYAGVSIYDRHPIEDQSYYHLVVEGDIFINVGVPELASHPGFSLGQSYPNPFHSLTTIEFSLSAPDRVVIRIIDPAGRVVRTLVDDSFQPGRYTATWNGTDQAGTPVGSGVYFYSMESARRIIVKRMVLLKSLK